MQHLTVVYENGIDSTTEQVLLNWKRKVFQDEEKNTSL